MKLFEDRQRSEGMCFPTGYVTLCMTDAITPGKTVSHGFAKELLAGFAGAEVDRLAETKGMNEYDAYESKKHAEKRAQNMYDEHYQNADQYDPQQYDQPNFRY